MKKTVIHFLSWGLLIGSHQATAFQFSTPVEGLEASLDSVVEYSTMYRTAQTERIVRDGQNLFANANDGSEYYSRGLVANEYKLTSELNLR